ncbi:hypothetical protein VNI00_017274 [Paramarasmius palmivorus]|uniref:Nuclear protein MDM1 n=1 Tax=Paramarasmius palmivorus TaxID=297713 RepID=A0AAW0B7C2_9AGAR
MLPRSYSRSQITLAVEGHPLKRRRLESFKSEANLPSSSQSRAIQLSPSPSCSRIPPPSSHELRTFVGAIPPRADSPVPTEPDADHADRADVERDLKRRWGIRVKDYARLPPPMSPRKDKVKQRATDSDERVWEAFFAKDAMGQYEWFMSRGSKEWLILQWEATEVLEESQERDERTEEDVTKMPPPIQQLGEKFLQSSPGPSRSLRPLVRTTHNPLVITCKRRTPSPPSTSSQPVSEQARPQHGLTRQDTQVLKFKPPSTATANPRRGLVRHARSPRTMTSIKTSSNSGCTTPPNSTASTCLQTPNNEEYSKTPLLLSPLFLQREQRRNMRKHGIPGKILHRLREIGWVTEDEARRRWLGCDWDEYHEYAVREETRGNTRKHQDEIGYMGEGEIGYPYYVIWGSVGTGGLGFKKGKRKDSEGGHIKELETAQEKEEPEEELAESQNVHATMSGTIKDLEKEQVSHDQEDAAITQESHDSGYTDTEPDSGNTDLKPEEEHNQNVHATLSGSLSPPPESPREPSSSTSTARSSRLQASPSQKEKKNNPLAPLYFHAIAEDSSLAFNRPPSRDYRRLLGERAGDVWNWLGKWVKYGRPGKAFVNSGFFENGALAGGGIKTQGTVGRGLVRNGTLSSIPGLGNGTLTHPELDKDRMDVDSQPRTPSSPKRLELPPNWLSSLSSLSSRGSDDEILPG